VGMQKGYSREEILRYTARMAKWVFGGEGTNKFKIKLYKNKFIDLFFIVQERYARHCDKTVNMSILMRSGKKIIISYFFYFYYTYSFKKRL
jgi:hypothetical protein